MPIGLNQTILDAQTSGISADVMALGEVELVVYVQGNGPVTAGQIQVKEAYDVGYTGSWPGILGGGANSIIDVPANAQAIRRYRGAFRAIRAEIITPVTGVGASVTVHIMVVVQPVSVLAE